MIKSANTLRQRLSIPKTSCIQLIKKYVEHLAFLRFYEWIFNYFEGQGQGLPGFSGMPYTAQNIHRG